MGRMSSPVPVSPGGDHAGGPLSGKWRILRVRTLVKYLASACVGMLLLLFLTQNAGTVKELANLSNLGAAGRVDTLKKSLKEMKELHEDRRRAVQDVCRRNGITPNESVIKPEMFTHIYVDDNHKFLYCLVPKVACTNFKRMLLILSGQVNSSSPLDLEASAVHSYLDAKLVTLNHFPIGQIKQKLATYYKFVFVRDPLERILSAYINKFTMRYNFYFHKRYGTRIIKRFRKNASADSLIGGHDVTFQEFVQYLLEPSASEPLNEHWRHYYKLCSPCAVQYDAIGKYETMAQDIDFVLEEIGVRHLINFPSGRAGSSKGRTTDLRDRYYQRLTSDQIHRLWEMYSVDYSMFRYPYPDFKGDGT